MYATFWRGNIAKYVFTFMADGSTNHYNEDHKICWIMNKPTNCEQNIFHLETYKQDDD
jgi:hypothetical protein